MSQVEVPSRLGRSEKRPESTHWQTRATVTQDTGKALALPDSDSESGPRRPKTRLCQWLNYFSSESRGSDSDSGGSDSNSDLTVTQHAGAPCHGPARPVVPSGQNVQVPARGLLSSEQSIAHSMAGLRVICQCALYYLNLDASQMTQMYSSSS